MSTTPFLLDASATTLEAAQANILASSTAQVAHLNEDLKNRYLSAFNDWCANVETGRIDTSNPPQPPNGWELAAPNADGFVFYQFGNTPVCEMPPLPEDHSKSQKERFDALPKNVIDVGRHIYAAWYSVGSKDTFECGKTTPPIPDAAGVPHIYEKFGAPVGAGWYLQIS